MTNIIKVDNNIKEQQAFSKDLFKRFINYVDARPSTIKSYTRNIRQFFIYLSSNGITNPTREDVLNYREDIKSRLKPTTVQNYITSLKVFFNWTEQEGLYPNIAKRVKGAKIDKEHKKDYLTASQVKQVLDGIDRTSNQGKRNYAIIALMITGGLRTIEVSRADISDISTVGGNRVLYLLGKGRDEKTEYIKLVPQVEQAIDEYLKTRTDKTGPLFTSTSNNSKGNRLSTRTVSNIVKEAFINVGYDSDRLTAHSTRHTAVTLALLNGNSLEEAQQFARHKNLETTMIYAHHIDRANNKCESSIANSIF